MSEEYLGETEFKSEEKSESSSIKTVLIAVVTALLVTAIAFAAVFFMMQKKGESGEENKTTASTTATTAATFSQQGNVQNGTACWKCGASGVNPADATGYLSCNVCGARWKVEGQKIILIYNGETFEIPIVINGNQSSDSGGTYYPPSNSAQGSQGGQAGAQAGSPQINQSPNQGGSVQTPQTPQTPQAPATDPVLSYNKAQLVDFYNAALKKSYTYKLNATKVEQVDVSVSGIDIGNLNLDADQFAQSIIANNTKNNGVKQTKSFINGKATDDGTSIQNFVVPTNLYADAVQSISIAQHNGGYKMVIKLKPETCAHNGTAKYNASCTWPLDVTVIDFGQAVTIQECTFNYPGTVLTALIDSQGRVYGVQTEMPLNVSNAKGSAVGVTINVGSIRGKWTCKNELKFF